MAQAIWNTREYQKQASGGNERMNDCMNECKSECKNDSMNDGMIHNMLCMAFSSAVLWKNNDFH